MAQTLTHGGNIWLREEPFLDFSASIHPLGMPPEVLTAAQQGVAASVHYPDPGCTALRRAIAMAQQAPEDWVLCGNGATDLMDLLARAASPRRALLPVPAFGEYERSLLGAGCQVERFPLLRADGFRVTRRLLERLTPELDWLCLANPNNPTGAAVEPELLQAIVRRCETLGITLVVDESFLALSDPEARTDLRPMLSSAPQLILLRSLTKSYGIPGLRLGYALSSNTALLNRLREYGQPWAVSVPAQMAGVAAMSRPDWPERAMEIVRPQRRRLRAGLEELGFLVFPSCTNYLMFEAPDRPGLREALLGRGILIRSCGDFFPLSKCFYRVAVRTSEENAALLRALQETKPEGGGRPDGSSHYGTGNHL